jgi:hypothetical protein
MYNGLVGVMYMLSDCVGNGGFVIVPGAQARAGTNLASSPARLFPIVCSVVVGSCGCCSALNPLPRGCVRHGAAGSHKQNHPYKLTHDSPLVANPAVPTGGCIIFTEVRRQTARGPALSCPAWHAFRGGKMVRRKGPSHGPACMTKRLYAMLNLKFTGLTQNLGQLQQSLIGIFSQTAGSTCEFWVNPVNYTFWPCGAGPRARHGELARRHRAPLHALQGPGPPGGGGAPLVLPTAHAMCYGTGLKVTP